MYSNHLGVTKQELTLLPRNVAMTVEYILRKLKCIIDQESAGIGFIHMESQPSDFSKDLPQSDDTRNRVIVG